MHRGKAEALQCTTKDSQGTAHKIRGMSGLVTGDEGLIEYINNDSSHNFPTLHCWNVLSKNTQATVLNMCVSNNNNNMQC